jgi:3-hydroxy-9,10-secoandrosta-1,3,5(10)-triene-9,17-dione monooxygenase reductase component
MTARDTSPLERTVSQPEFDSAKFRQVLGHFPTGVTVITAITGGEPVGMAVGSFASLSLEPALVLFCPGNQSSSWPKIREAGSFCVNILGADQEHVSRVFASKETDKFGQVTWRRTSQTGSPHLDGVLAWIDCTIEQILPGGDHDIVVGRVQDLDTHDSPGPLIFYRGGYGHYES